MPTLLKNRLVPALALALACAPAVLSQDPPPTPTVEELEACMREQVPDQPGRLALEVETIDRAGVSQAMDVAVSWTFAESLNRTLLEVTGPAKLAGSALLTRERPSGQPELYVSLPRLKKVRKIRSKRLRGAVLGTDINFEELFRLQRKAEDAKVEVVGPERLEGRPVWVVEARPAGGGVDRYERVVSHVDQEHCVALQIEFFDGPEGPRKRLSVPADGLERHNSYTIPRRFTMQDLRDGTRTVVRVTDVALPADLPPESFTKAALADAKLEASAAVE